MEPPYPPVADADVSALVARTSALAPQFVGLTMAEASTLAHQHGLELYPVDESQPYMLLMNLVPNRVTVYFAAGTDGRIVRAVGDQDR